MKHHAGVVLFGVEDFLVISFAEQGENRSVKAVGGLDDVGDELLVCVGVEVFELLAAVFLVAGEVEVGSVVGAVDFAPAEWEEEFYVAGGFGVVSELFVVVVAEVFGAMPRSSKYFLPYALK